ncbi:hypothetical protein Rs2_35629 [Raphanus sativus]|nr:hypothetical protein Rs2_35629 [Raphanus sativus]
MKFGGRGRYNGKGKGKGKGKADETQLLCHCGVPAKCAQAWTNKNPGRRFYGCVRWKTPLDCGFFQWINDVEPSVWQKQALIEARNEIWQNRKTIMELKKIISQHESELGKNADLEEDIINGFLKLRFVLLACILVSRHLL